MEKEKRKERKGAMKGNIMLCNNTPEVEIVPHKNRKGNV